MPSSADWSLYNYRHICCRIYQEYIPTQEFNLKKEIDEHLPVQAPISPILPDENKKSERKRKKKSTQGPNKKRTQ